MSPPQNCKKSIQPSPAGGGCTVANRYSFNFGFYHFFPVALSALCPETAGQAWNTKHIYFLAAAAGNQEYVPQRTIAGLQGWIDCCEKAELKSTVFCGGVDMPGDIAGNEKLNAAYEMGRRI